MSSRVVYASRCLQKFADFDDEDDFTELHSAPSVQSLTASAATAILPDFTKYKVDDLFHELGPLNIFSARHKWTAPRCVNLRRRTSDEEFGFSVRGQSPVIVTAVENSSLAQRACMRAGDFITAVGCKNVKWGCHNNVISLIHAAGNILSLHLVTPLDCNYLEPPVPCSPQVVTRMQAGTLKKGDTRVHRKSWTGGSWKLRKRRSKSREGKTDRNGLPNGKH
ncbi:Rhophilin-2 [Lamellibrachia satsuma]|nr:Rhophilin-2 [Lamellibrachia satsuma]